MNTSLVSCEKVYIKEADEKGLGAFASSDIKYGQLVERGVIRRVDIDGNNSPYLFTWSEDHNIWGFASGCATFYNTSLDPNTKMIRNYEDDTFEIYAIRDISKDEELTHKYKSLKWRKCFKELNDMLNDKN